MRCREVGRLITYGQDAERAARFEVTQHARSCEKCSEELAASSVIKTILESYSHTDNEQFVWEEARLVNRVKSGIQAAKENGLGTWESAVISIRGWLVGFAAAAILLLALSGQLAVSKPVDEKDNGAPEQISSTNSTLTEDLISSNTQANWISEANSEEIENVR